jgi:hypothetical protein
MSIKKLVQLFLAVCFPALLMSQVTNSSITGTIKGVKNEMLEGATVTAIHQPSGTKYVTVSKKGGVFTLPGMRTGGPYQVTLSYVGYKPQIIDGFSLNLGEPYNINAEMQLSSDLTSVTVLAVKKRGADKTGVATIVGSREINSLPTISRSITDFTRLTPQANGNSFAGRDGRFNNVTVDGANLNNNFGLSTDPLPGGGNQPISLDAIEQVSVAIAPIDVRQSNFTGANVAAITKSGTNTLKGSIYTLYKDQSYTGTKVGVFELPALATTKSQISGGTVGGAIIKNKLFFFVNAEWEKKTNPPGTSYTPTGGSGGGNVSSVRVDSLKKLSDYLQSTYGYATGAYDNFPNFHSQNHKYLVKLDWNISNVHKLTLKYNELVSNNDVALNSSSVPNSATSGANSWTSQARFGPNAMSFANSNYGFLDVVRSIAVELNSNFSSSLSNQFIATYTKIQDTRTTPSALFPFVDIIGDATKSGLAATYAGGAKSNYMSFGTEPYSNNNDVLNKIYNVTDNLTYYAGKHTITAGVAYEYQSVGNMFMPASQSYYTYGSLADFMNPAAHPIAYALTYSRVPGVDAVYSAQMKIAQGSLYAQDEFNVSPRFKLTYGVRLDLPMYPEQPLENPAITALTFNDKDGNPAHYSTGMWPKATVYVSPRVGFRWDTYGDRSLVFHGSTGIYTGKLPFVYFTNMPTNSGMYQVSALATAAQLSSITFNADPNAYQSIFTTPAPVPNSAGFVLLDPNYKFPQVFRTNLGFDKKLGMGWTLTMDAIYTSDLNATVMRNANEATPTGTVNLGGSTRPSFSANTTATRRVYNAYANAIVLENTKGGGAAFSFTTQLSKAFTNGFYGSIAYTYTSAVDLTANPGSTASSTWSGNPTSGTQNTKELSNSAFIVPHRIVASLSYRTEYLKHLASTFSLFYEGAIQGTLSYVYGAASGTAPSGFANTADVNYDGNSSDLMYIPKNPGEITFTPLTVGSTTYSADQQRTAFFNFIAQDRYLSKHMGEVAKRNGAKLPFYHRVDFRFLQDVFTNIGSRKNTVQFSFDCLNVLNLISKNLGVKDFFVVNNPLRATKNATTGEVRYQLATYTPNGATTPQLVDHTTIESLSTSSTYSFQVGLRYIF